MHVSFQTNESGQDGDRRFKAWNLHVIVSHGKNGSRTGGANQAGKLPQQKTHNNGVFAGLGVIVGPMRDGPETALLIQGLRSVIGAPNL